MSRTLPQPYKLPIRRALTGITDTVERGGKNTLGDILSRRALTYEKSGAAPPGKAHCVTPLPGL
jgi:hypothetical protein